MKERFYIISLLTVLLTVVPAQAGAYLNGDSSVSVMAGFAAASDGQPETIITLSGRTLRITNAAGQQLDIVNITGVNVLSHAVAAEDERVNLSLPKGCYIVKVGTVVRKISIR